MSLSISGDAMKRIYDWDAKFSLRNYTASDLRALKGIRKLVQTTANTSEESAVAKDGADSIYTAKGLHIVERCCQTNSNHSQPGQ